MGLYIRNNASFIKYINIVAKFIYILRNYYKAEINYFV